MFSKSKDEQLDVVAELLRKNGELRELLRYAFEIIEGFIPYKKRTFVPPGIEYSERYQKIRSIVEGDRENRLWE